GCELVRDLGLQVREPVEEREPVAEQAWREEVGADVLLAARRSGARQLRVAQRLETRLGAFRRRIDKPAGLAVDDLDDDAADPPGDRRPPLPQRLADSETKTLAG